MSNNLKGKKVFITGGMGFIGSHIVEDLLNEGAKIRIYDNFSTGLSDNLSGVVKDVEIVRGDILDYDQLAKAMHGFDIVSHQAAQLEITKAVSDPVFDLQINTIGSLNVFKAAIKNGVEKIINASSAAVYGQAKIVPQNENHPTDPNWPYGVSKLANEKYANILQELNKIKITHLRYAIVYGPREWYRRVLTVFIKRSISDLPLIIFGDGRQIRDFIYVKDLVKFHNLVIKDDKYSGQTFNVSSGIGTSINALAKMVLKVSSKEDLKIIYENPKFGESSSYFNRIRLPLELKKMILSYDKGSNLLKWKPEVALIDGLRREYEWVLDNKKRWS